MLSDSDFLRFSRHIMLPQIGEPGQQRIQQSYVTIVGAGGLACIAAPYLAAAGVAQISLIDADIVTSGNLPRQWQYSELDLQQAKVTRLAARLRKISASLNVVSYQQMLTWANIAELLAGTELILDCSDNMASRQLINRYAVMHDIPLISAAATGLTAQCIAINGRYLGEGSGYGCYYCLYPFDELLPGNCQTQGVLGPVVGVAASYQAGLALRALAGDPDMRWSLLWHLDQAAYSQAFMHIPQDPACPVCSQGGAGIPPEYSQKTAE